MPGSPPFYFGVIPYGNPAVTQDEVLKLLVQDLPKIGYTDMQKGTTYVACRTPNSHDAVTFVGPWGKGSWAVIMSTGDDASKSCDKIVKRMQNYTFL